MSIDRAASVFAMSAAVACANSSRPDAAPSSAPLSQNTQTATASPAAPSSTECNDLAFAASSVAVSAAKSAKCSTDGDCRPARSQKECWDSCWTRHLSGGPGVEQALADAQPRVVDACEKFESRGCAVEPSSCPPAASGAVRCVNAECVFQ
jgi:hypothetical protein